MRVAVVGLGVMGGSLARALVASPLSPEVTGWDADPQQTAAAVAAGALTRRADDLAAAGRDADVVVVATPLGALPGLLADLAPTLAPDALVVDVASLQVPALAAGAAAGLAERHVSAHPLTGSEASGFAASRPDLYADAQVTLSVAIPEGRGGGEGILARARDFWTGLGAVPVVESAEAHDARMALASHLPQLVANGLARVLDARGVTCEALGPGGRDMTRLAASSPEMWVDLLAHGGPRLGGALRALGREMDRLAAVLERGDMGAVAEIMKETRAWRER